MAKGQDIENAVRSVLHGLGVRIAKSPKATFPQTAHALVPHDAVAKAVIEPLLRVRAAIAMESAGVDAAVRPFAGADPVCRRLMTAPQVSPLTALTVRCGVDEPRQFKRSRSVGAHFGMTPRTRQSGDVSSRGHISRWGDRSVRRALYLAARGLVRQKTRPFWLRAWAEQGAERRGRGKANIAAARRLGVILHQM